MFCQIVVRALAGEPNGVAKQFQGILKSQISELTWYTATIRRHKIHIDERDGIFEKEPLAIAAANY